MKAAVFLKPGEVDVVEVPKPSVSGGGVVIRVEVALMCGTDVKTFRRGHPLISPPRVMGHEYSGVVVEAGQDGRFREGDRVAGVNSGPCMGCRYCIRGRENLCESLHEALIGFTCDGVFAEYCKIPSRIARVNLLKISEKTSFEEAAFLEPLSCVVHGLSRVDTGVRKAAILGSGSIGLMHLQSLKLMNNDVEVTVFDPHWEKLGMAERMGADRLVNIREEDLSKHYGGFELVIESVGRVEAWEKALKLVEKGGEVLFFGGCPKGTTITLDTYRMHYEELRLVGAFHHTPRDVKKALEMIESRKLRLTEMIGYRGGIEDIHEALDKMMKGEVLKAMLTP